MPLQKVGVQYVGQDFTRFLSEMNQAIKAISGFGKMTKNKLSAMSEMTKQIQLAGDAMVKLANAQARSERVKAMTRKDVVQARVTVELAKLAQQEEKTKQKTIALQIAQTKLSQSQVVHASATKKSSNAHKQGAQAAQKGAQATQNLAQQIVQAAVSAMQGTAAYKAYSSAMAVATAVSSALNVAIAPIAAIAIVIAAAILGVVAAFAALKLAINIIKGAFNILKGALNVLLKLFNLLLTPVKKFASFIRDTLVHTLGNLASQAVNKLSDSLRNLFDQMLDGAATFQYLKTRLTGIVAAEIAATNGIDDFSVAMEMAVDPTRQLIEWINTLALKSPFSRDDIANVYSLAAALGFTTGQSTILTKALTDWASGMSLDSDKLELIMYNFGQMRAQGKLTATELRDAARGGLIPVNDILMRIGTNAGLSGDALTTFADQAAKSGVDVDTFFKEFVALAEERFPNAAEKMSRTWKGVANNIQDFIRTIVGADVLTPVLDEISGSMADMLNNLMSPEVRAGAKLIGETLVYAYHQLKEGVKVATEAIRRFAEAAGLPRISIAQIGALIQIVADYLKQFAIKVGKWIDGLRASFEASGKSFYEWGKGLMANFAKGMIAGIKTFVVMALKALGNLLMSFLRPHSPPKVALAIRDWGGGIIIEYIEGMKEVLTQGGVLAGVADAMEGAFGSIAFKVDLGFLTAYAETLHKLESLDFDILTEVGNRLKSIFEVFKDLGKISELAGLRNFTDLSIELTEAIAQYRETGVLDETIFAKIAAAAGEFGTELALLARDYFTLADATKAAEEAEKALKQAQDNLSRSRQRVHTEIRKYNAQLRAGAGKGALDAQLRIVNAAERQVEIDKQREEAAQTAKEAADAELARVKEMVELQAKVVDQMLAMVQIQADMKKAKESGGAGETENPFGDFEWDVAPPDFGDFDDILEQLRLDMDAAKTNIENWFDGIGHHIYLFFRARKSEIKQAGDDWDEFIKGLSKTLKKEGISERFLSITANVNGAIRAMGVTIDVIFGGDENGSKPGWGLARFMLTVIDIGARLIRVAAEATAGWVMFADTVGRKISEWTQKIDLAKQSFDKIFDALFGEDGLIAKLGIKSTFFQTFSQIINIFSNLSIHVGNVARFLTDINNAIKNLDLVKLFELLGLTGERAYGGDIEKGGRYTVNENMGTRPETFISKTNGYILNKQDAMRSLTRAYASKPSVYAPASRMSAPATSGGVVIHSVNIYGGMSFAEFDARWKRSARRSL